MPRWYVIQVTSGQESTTRDLIEQIASNEIKKVFIPRREVLRHRGNNWLKVRENLFPGYVFVESSNPRKLADRLSSVPAFTRLLGGDEYYSPLAEYEVELIQTLSDDEHVVGVSEGIIEGDTVRILRGPLRDREATIIKIDRHHRNARVGMSILGREVTVTLGLEIVRKD